MTPSKTNEGKFFLKLIFITYSNPYLKTDLKIHKGLYLRIDVSYTHQKDNSKNYSSGLNIKFKIMYQGEDKRSSLCG